MFLKIEGMIVPPANDPLPNSFVVFFTQLKITCFCIYFCFWLNIGMKLRLWAETTALLSSGRNKFAFALAIPQSYKSRREARFKGRTQTFRRKKKKSAKITRH